MKTKFWILSCVFFAASCSSDERPEHILSKEQMVGLMIDMQVAQTRVNLLKLKSDSAKQLYTYYKDYLLEEHMIEDSTFYESFAYYLSRPNDLNIIHEAVLDTLNFQLQKIEAQEEKDANDKAERDSLKSIKKKKEMKPVPTKLS